MEGAWTKGGNIQTHVSRSPFVWDAAESGEKRNRREPQARDQLPWHHHAWVQISKESKNSDTKLGLSSDYRET